MTTIQLELPDETAAAAREAGLLTSQSLDRLLTEALQRRRAAERLLATADRVGRSGAPTLTPEEIDSEVQAVRRGRRQRAGRP